MWTILNNAKVVQNDDNPCQTGIMVNGKVYPTGGASSWNDIPDKPFYEETTTVGGDTLTWDGNTEGLVSVDMGGQKIYCISDAVPTLADCVNGTHAIHSDGSEVDYPYQAIEGGTAAFGVLMPYDGMMVAAYDNQKVDVSGGSGVYVTFPKAGVYTVILNSDGDYVASLTIPGYTGFVAKQTVVKPIDTKYLPEHLHFGTETKVVEGDTLTWDGNLEGHLLATIPDYPNIAYVKVSDSVVTIDDLKNGCVETLSGREDPIEYELSDFQRQSDEQGVIGTEGSFFVQTDGFVFMDMITFPEAGVYFIWMEGEPHTTSITIPNYGKFVSEQTVTKPMDEKYLPILTSPGGKKFKLSVDDSGAVTATEVT